MSRTQCPNCDGRDTERVNVEWFVDLVEETRICDCGATFTVSFGNPYKDIIDVVDT